MNDPKIIEHLLAEKRELLTTTDLVKIGIYSSDKAAYNARKRKISSPPFILVGKRVLYPRDDLKAFLEHGGGNGVENAGKGPASWVGGALKGTDKWKAKKEQVDGK